MNIYFKGKTICVEIPLLVSTLSNLLYIICHYLTESLYQQSLTALKQRSSLSDVSAVNHQAHSSPPSSSPHVNLSDTALSGSALSGGVQLYSTTSGYAAMGSGNSTDDDTMFERQAQAPHTAAASTAGVNSHAQSKVVVHHELGSHLSYPLEKLLSHPVSYDDDGDEGDLLDHDYGAHFYHHGNTYHPQHIHQHHRGALPTNIPLLLHHPDYHPHSHSHSRVQGFHQVPHGSLDHIGSFNPAGLGRSTRTSPGLPNVTVPPPLGTITVDIDV